MERAHDVHFRVPSVTILKLAGFALLALVIVKLWPFFLVIFMAALLAVTLHPLASRIEKRGLSRGPAVLIVAAMLLVVIVGLGALVGPPLAHQLSELAGDYDGFRQHVSAHMSPKYSAVNKAVGWMLAAPRQPEVREYFSKPIQWGMAAGEMVASGLLVLVLSLYLLFDGKRLYAWLLAYVPRKHRAKMAATVPEVSDVVLAYVVGQVVTSALVAVFSGIVLTVFHVPAALPLAMLAGVADVLPFIGVLIFTVPAVLLAFTASPVSALAVLGLFTAYHLFENYVIVPRVYGNRLRLSTLAVILALVVGGILQGVIGALLVLPIVAAYPIIERIWLRDYLSEEVLEDHEVLEHAEGGKGEAAVDAVLNAEAETPAGTPLSH